MNDRSVATAQEPRQQQLSTFQTLKDWIIVHKKTHSSFVHDAVDFQDRTLIATRPLAAHTELFCLPVVVVAHPTTASTHTDEAALAVHLWNQRDNHQLSPYWNALPPLDELEQQLPRNWPPCELQQLLGGSSVGRCVQRQQEAARVAYQTVVASSHNIAWRDFSQALAVVSTRAFQVNDHTIGMVPFLDLCNHHRGGTLKKNLSYQFVVVDNHDPNNNNNHDYICRVCTTCDIAAGQTLRITYGARSNTQLLTEYGFVLCDNFEPDGSSNSIVEIVFATTTVPLRMGPKSYTYGPLVSLLGAAVSHQTSGTANSAETATNPINANDDKSMEAFLLEQECYNAQEEEEEDDNESVDLYAEADPCSTYNNEPTKRQLEMDALKRARQALVDGASRYALQKDSMERILQSSKKPRARYAALCIKCELQTLHFFVAAIDKIAWQLNGKVAPVPVVDFVHWSDKERCRMELQTSELADVFVRIRHPF